MSHIGSMSEADKNEWRNFVRCVFRQWFGLQAAIAHGMGGMPQQVETKLTNMIESTVNLCLSKDVSTEDLCDTLEDFADEYFDTDFQDGSVAGVSYDIWKRTQDWLVGNKESIHLYINAHSSSNNSVIIERLDSGSEDEEQMEVEPVSISDASNSDNTGSMSVTKSVDAEVEEGWTIARHKRKGNR